MKLYTAENCTNSYQTHVTEVVENMMGKWYPFVKLAKVFGYEWIFI
jgi:hypothetical protein